MPRVIESDVCILGGGNTFQDFECLCIEHNDGLIISRRSESMS